MKQFKAKVMSLVLVFSLVLSNFSVVSASSYAENQPTENYVGEATELIKEYPIEDTSKFGSRRLIVKGEYVGDTFGAVDVLYKYSKYTILQYETKEETEVAYTNLLNSGISVSIDSIIEVIPQAIPNTEEHLDNGVSMMGLDTLQLNPEYTDENYIVGVAVIDTGISESSPIYSRVSEQVDYTVSEGEQAEEISNKHGEEVAGIIVDSTSDNVVILSLRIFDNGGAAVSELTVSTALDYAAEWGADVVNMSLGFEKADNSESDFSFLNDSIDALINKGTPVVVASGNGDSNESAMSTDYVYPACYEPCWTVGAISDNKQIADFSNYGDVDFVAKGVAVSTVTGNGESVSTGTSYSTPYISAFTAILKGHPSLRELSVDELKTKVINSCEDLGEEGYDEYYGWGLPIAPKLLQMGGTICEDNGHSYKDEPDSKIEPTCTELGYNTYICTVCGHEKTEEVEMLEHNYEKLSCDCEANTITYKCSDCGDEKTEESEENLVHNWVIDEDAEQKEATCTEDGVKNTICTECGAKESEVLEACHLWDDGVVTEPTCITGGYTTYTCTRDNCGVTEKRDEVAENGHDITVEHSRKNATCKSTGYVNGECKDCGQLVKEDLPINENNHAGTKTTKRTEAKCGVDGKIETICNDCGKVISTTKIPKLKHKQTTKRTEPTCSKEGSIVTTCTLCNKTLNTVTLPKVAHTFKEERTEPTKIKDGKVVRTCTVCKHTETEVLPKKGFVVGDTFTKGNYKLKVTKAGEVSVIGSTVKKTNKRFKSVNIGKSISYGGFTFKVTSVGARAFKGYKYITQVTIGENVRSIGKEAFYGCSVKIIKIQGTKLKSIGKDAFKNIKSNATFKVPKSKVKYYKKLLKKKTGYKSTMKVKKK